MEWDKPIVMLNGQVPIMSAAVRNQIQQRRLAGASYHPFDDNGNYLYLATSRELGRMIVRPNEVLGLKNDCDECGLPRWELNFGPLRYSRADWRGEDFICSAFEEGPVYSPTAFEVLGAFDKTISRASPLYLE